MTYIDQAPDLPLAITASTSLIVVDMQVDFGLPEGSLYVAGAEQIVEPINQLISTVIAAGGSVFYTQDYHPSETPHFVGWGGLWPPHGVAGTPGAELLPSLAIAGPVIRKGTDGRDGYSGFSVRDPQSGETESTALEVLLREADARALIVVGLAGDYCVGETAIDGVQLGFPTVMPLALTRFVNLNAGDAAKMIDRAVAAGVTVPTAEDFAQVKA